MSIKTAGNLPRNAVALLAGLLCGVLFFGVVEPSAYGKRPVPAPPMGVVTVQPVVPPLVQNGKWVGVEVPCAQVCSGPDHTTVLESGREE
jgi:hypothetical protein